MNLGRRQARIPSPFTPEELARARLVAQRLYATCGALLKRLPGAARGASATARELGVARNTCQRMVAALRDTDVGPAMLGRLPGVRGLRLLSADFRRFGVTKREAADRS